jgi:hypothetical protein
VAFAASALRHPKSLFAPKALDFLVVHLPTFTSGVVIRGPETPPGMILGVGAQPVPQRCVRVIGSRCDGFVTVSGAVLPGHAAGEPFADPQHPLEMTNSGPPAFRA